MKTIGIADFEKLVMERLENPQEFVGRSLVLWNADDKKYGITSRVITQCCEKYNKEKPNDQVWFKISDSTYKEDDYTKRDMTHIKYVWDENDKRYKLCPEPKRCGILFNSGDYLPLDKKEQADWLNFVNTHTNNCGKVSPTSAVIVCAKDENMNTYGNPPRPVTLKEQQFGKNCDVYCIQPTIDEWYIWAKSCMDQEIVDVVHAYIKKNGVINSFDYWQYVMYALEPLKRKFKCSLRQIPKDDVELKVIGVMSKRKPAPDFCDFIYE